MFATDLAALLLKMAMSTGGILPAPETVALREDLPASCISLPAHHGWEIIVDTRDVEAMAAHSGGPWKTEQERLRIVYASHARELLAGRGEEKDQFGCHANQILGAPQFAMVALTRIGRARIWDPASQRFLSKVTLEDRQCSPQDWFGGFTFRTQDGKVVNRVARCTPPSAPPAPPQSGE